MNRLWYNGYGNSDSCPPNIYRNQKRCFHHPTPALPTIAAVWPYNLTYSRGKSSSECRHWKSVGDSEATNIKITQRGNGLQNQMSAIRENSLKKILPWRIPSNEDTRKYCFHTGKEIKYGVGNVLDTDNGEKFQNLVKVSNILGAHATKTNARNNDQKYSVRDWNFNTNQLCSGATCIHNTVAMIQQEANQCINETGKEQLRCSLDTSDDLSTRLDEVLKWTHKLEDELNHNISQFHELLELKERLLEILKNIAKPLEISKENKQTRNARPGVELVRDAVEESLHRETEIFQKRQDILLREVEKLNSQLTRLRDCRHEIEVDIQKKIQAKETDECVKLLSTLSKEIGPMEIPHRFSFHTSPTAWLQHTQNIIQKSQDERNLAQMLSIDVSREMLGAGNECFGIWYATNAALSTRVTEIIGAKKQIEHHIHKLDKDIATLRSHIEDVQIALAAKIPLLQLAQSRLDKRKERPGIELCRDKAMVSLLREMQTLRNAVDLLTAKRTEMETTLEHLLKTKSTLERDLKLKNMALFLDKEKCLSLRHCFPISTFQEARSAKPLSAFMEDKRRHPMMQR